MKWQDYITLGDTRIECSCFYPEDGIADYYRMSHQGVRYEFPDWLSLWEVQEAVEGGKITTETELLNAVSSKLREQLQERLEHAQRGVQMFSDCGLSMFHSQPDQHDTALHRGILHE